MRIQRDGRHGNLRLVTTPKSTKVAALEARIRDCERRIRKLEGILQRLPDEERLRFIGAGLLTEFKVALRTLRTNRQLLIKSS